MNGTRSSWVCLLWPISQSFGVLGPITCCDPPTSLPPTHTVYMCLLWAQLCLPLSFLSSYFSPTDGQLRHIKTGEPFVFNAREDLHRWNQKRYEALGEVTHHLGRPCSAPLASSIWSFMVFILSSFCDIILPFAKVAETWNRPGFLSHVGLSIHRSNSLHYGCCFHSDLSSKRKTRSKDLSSFQAWCGQVLLSQVCFRAPALYLWFDHLKCHRLALTEMSLLLHQFCARSYVRSEIHTRSWVWVQNHAFLGTWASTNLLWWTQPVFIAVLDTVCAEIFKHWLCIMEMQAYNLETAEMFQLMMDMTVNEPFCSVSMWNSEPWLLTFTNLQSYRHSSFGFLDALMKFSDHPAAPPYIQAYTILKVHQ